jgi:hypothetical protein
LRFAGLWEQEYPEDVVWTACLAEEPELTPANIGAYTNAIRAYVSTRMVDGEVGNGGWEQLFYNDEGEWITEAIQGWRLFGSPDHASLLDEARRVAPVGHRDRDAARKRRTWAAFTTLYHSWRFAALNQRWMDLQERGDQLRSAYLRAHEAEFGEPAKDAS